MTYTPGQFSKLPPLATVTLPCCSLLHRRRDSCRHSSWSTLACQVPLHVTGVHTCGLRTLNPNRPGNSLKMQIGLPGFPTHVVRDALEAAFPKLLASRCYSHIWKPLG